MQGSHPGPIEVRNKSTECTFCYHASDRFALSITQYQTNKQLETETVTSRKKHIRLEEKTRQSGSGDLKVQNI